MQNHKRTETASRLKKVYSSLSQAIKLAEIEQGAPISEWGNTWGESNGSQEGYYVQKYRYSALYLWDKYLSKYLQVSNNNHSCGESSNDFSFCDYLIQFGDGSQIVGLSDTVSTSGTDAGTPGLFYFIVDTNGFKDPNKEGSDRFRFYLNLKENPKHLLGGYLVYKEVYNSKTNYTREELLKECKSSYLYCLDLIMNDSWEIKNDYPRRL